MLITDEKVKELRKIVSVFERLIDQDAINCLETIEKLWKVAKAAKDHVRFPTAHSRTELKEALKSLEGEA